jgi:hypothetical protein
VIYDGLNVSTAGSVMSADVGGATGAFTVDGGCTVRNTLRQTVYVEACDVTPDSVGAVQRARLVPGGTLTLPAPQGVWLVIFYTQLRVEWAIGWAATGTILMYGLAGWGAGDIAGRIWAARRG